MRHALGWNSENTGNRVASSHPNRLILFTRYPEPGRTKTRLIPCLGAQGAAALQRNMTERLLAVARRYATGRACSLEIRYEGGTLRKVLRWLGPHIRVVPQGDGHLGRRMGRAFEAAFEAGAVRAVLVGTDIPGITPSTLKRAFRTLAHHDLVFGPAEDGGYYLVGMHRRTGREAIFRIFGAMPWGTSAVLGKTLDVARRYGFTFALTESLRDVDRPEDLPVWEKIAGKPG